jgi:hypothetical protein
MTPTEAGDHLCPRCGASYAAGQEYCLDCGLRLAAEGGVVGTLSTVWRDRFGWYPGDWVWPVLLGLLIAVIGGIAAVLVAGSGNGSSAPIVATHAGAPREPVSPPVTATVALPTVPRGTPSTSGPPTTPTTAPPATTTSGPGPGSLTAWPANRNGFTVVLESVPSRAGRSFAVARARSASRSGLPQVGVLDSSRYSSLHPGYYVVFSGIYSSNAEAVAAARTATGKGFASAYSRQITR